MAISLAGALKPCRECVPEAVRLALWEQLHGTFLAASRQIVQFFNQNLGQLALHAKQDSEFRKNSWE